MNCVESFFFFFGFCLIEKLMKDTNSQQTFVVINAFQKYDLSLFNIVRSVCNAESFVREKVVKW